MVFSTPLVQERRSGKKSQLSSFSRPLVSPPQPWDAERKKIKVLVGEHPWMGCNWAPNASREVLMTRAGIVRTSTRPSSGLGSWTLAETVNYLLCFAVKIKVFPYMPLSLTFTLHLLSSPSLSPSPLRGHSRLRVALMELLMSMTRHYVAWGPVPMAEGITLGRYWHSWLTYIVLLPWKV